ncbi:MAG: hypothetical protein IPM53_24940 [Anaerolineaceae bacterium]|nr:hypothetical protein [Anaerolineaceae bacterium]
MNKNKKTNNQERKTKVPALNFMQVAGVAAILAGLCFIVVGLFHQENVPASVTTATWVNVHIFAIFMGFLGLFGMAGIHARQAEKSGWLGLIGYLLFSVWLMFIIPFSFIEAFILPGLATELPAYVAGFLGMFTGIPSAIDLGILPTFWKISDPMYLLGPLLFGIATFRAGVLPRWAGGVFILGSTLAPVGALLVSPEFQSLVMVPNGVALAWLGYALFSERREKASKFLVDQGALMPEPGKVA